MRPAPAMMIASLITFLVFRRVFGAFVAGSTQAYLLSDTLTPQRLPKEWEGG